MKPAEIAKQVGVSPMTVARDMKEMKKEQKAFEQIKGKIFELSIQIIKEWEVTDHEKNYRSNFSYKKNVEVAC